MAKRFYHIAFDLGVRPRAFIRQLANVGLSVGNQMVIVPESLEERIREVYDQLHPDPEVVAARELAERQAAEAAARAAAEAEAASAAPAEMPTAEAPVAEPQAPGEEAAADEASQLPDAEPGIVIDENTKVHEAGAKPKAGSLVPGLDPRAGRLVKDAPAGGVPVAPTPRRGGDAPASPTRGRVGGPGTGPARRGSGTDRRGPARPYQRRTGRQTFRMPMRGRGRGRRTKGPAVPKVRPESIEVELPITVKRFCELSTYKAAEIIKILFRNHKIMVTPNSTLDKETVEILSIELEIEVNFVKRKTKEDELIEKFETAELDENLSSRPPVVTILGHVDHGKTTLLDCIRKSDIAAREAGGITQHISSSVVTLEDGRKITFIDTPGHEAFTEMRARGAQVTDVVILIVAGDDGVMPQTKEAISHAKAADVELVVAITKCDKDSARPDRVKQMLAEQEVFVEGYGGDVSVFEVSGITGQGVPQLLEHLALMAEVDADRYRANPGALATGTVLESQSNPKRGILATVLVQNGTLRKGDAILADSAFGTVRGLFDDKGKMIKEAGPSTPVEIIGLDNPPEAGERFYQVKSAAEGKKIASGRAQRAREAELAAQAKPTSMEALLSKIDLTKIESVNVIVKADVGGSIQPLKRVLGNLANAEVRVKILHSGVGPINESDVGLAAASGAMIIGFNVNADAKARQKAKKSGVDWRTYKIIYDIVQDVRDAMEGRLAPEYVERVIGHAEILAIFTFSKVGNIAGCRVRDGMLQREAFVRVRRDGKLIHEGQLSTLRREKDDVKEVKEGFECGLTVKDWDQIEVGDIVEAYVIDTIKRTLKDVKEAEPAPKESADAAS